MIIIFFELFLFYHNLKDIFMYHLQSRKEKISLTASSFSPQAQGWEGGLVPDSLRPSPAPSRLVGWSWRKTTTCRGYYKKTYFFHKYIIYYPTSACLASWGSTPVLLLTTSRRWLASVLCSPAPWGTSTTIRWAFYMSLSLYLYLH